MKNDITRILILVFISITIISCNNKKDRERIKHLTKEINNTIGKTLIIPDSLETYIPPYSLMTQSDFEDQRAENTFKLKLFSHIDASCGTCVESILSWDSIIPKLKKKNVQVNLICSSSSDFELLKYFFESEQINNFSHYLLLDNKNVFLEDNPFMSQSKNFETTLVNNNNEILLIGNPIYSKEMKDIYFEKIKEYLAETH